MNEIFMARARSKPRMSSLIKHSHMQAAAKLYQAQVTEEAAKETNRILLKIELRLDQLGTLVSEAS
jgi:hypothetical protein